MHAPGFVVPCYANKKIIYEVTQITCSAGLGIPAPKARMISLVRLSGHHEL